MKYEDFKLLNSQSSVDCNEDQMEKHRKEIEKLACVIYDAVDRENGSWVVRSAYADPQNAGREPVYRHVYLDQLGDLLESADLEHGLNIGFTAARFPSVVFVAHGTDYGEGQNAHVSQVFTCRLLNERTTRELKAQGFPTSEELKALFHDRTKQTSLQPCVKECKRVLSDRSHPCNRER